MGAINAPALAELLLRCRDHILGLVETASEPPSPERLGTGAALIAELGLMLLLTGCAVAYQQRQRRLVLAASPCPG